MHSFIHSSLLNVFFVSTKFQMIFNYMCSFFVADNFLEILLDFWLPLKTNGLWFYRALCIGLV